MTPKHNIWVIEQNIKGESGSWAWYAVDSTRSLTTARDFIASQKNPRRFRITHQADYDIETADRKEPEA